jgi:hypothetical protein
MAKNNTAMLPVEEVQQGYADSWSIGGSRFPFYSQDAFDPYAYVGTTTVVPMALLSAPPTYGQLDASAANYGTTGSAARNASASPWNPGQSPLVPTVVALVIGVYVFHWLYYKNRKRGK